MKRYIAIFIMFGLCLSLSACNKVDDCVKAEAVQAGEIISNGSFNELSELVFGVKKEGIDADLGSELELPGYAIGQSGPLEIISKKVTVMLKSINENTAIYEVTAPDMSSLFADLAEVNNDTIVAVIEEYVDNTELVTRTVELSYTLDNGHFNADFASYEFVNAITGGLLDGYTQAYQDLVDLIQKEIVG